MPPLMGMSMFGVYSLAVSLSENIDSLMFAISHNVLFPAYSKIARDNPDRLTAKFYHSRFLLDALFLTATGLLMMGGPWLVNQLYGGDFQAAGPMLRILCMRLAFSCVMNPMECVLTAKGVPIYGLLRNVARAVTVLVAVPLGWHLGYHHGGVTAGVAGVVWGVAISEVPGWLVLIFGLLKEHLLRVERELLSAVFLGLAMLVGWEVVKMLPPHMLADFITHLKHLLKKH